jgi:hypothetical protein
MAVRSEHVTNLSARNTNITGGDIGVGANVSGQLTHESLAEATDLVVRLALGVEVGATFATTHADYIFYND